MNEGSQPGRSPFNPDLVEYVLVAVPDVSRLEGLAAALVELVESAAIRVLDLVVLHRRAGDTTVTVLELEEVEGLLALREVDGEVGGYLSGHDIELASLGLEPDTAGILLLVEDSWAEPLARAARSAGGHFVGGERIPRERLSLVLPALLAEQAGGRGAQVEEERRHETGRDDTA
jgi:hypothetical protein